MTEMADVFQPEKLEWLAVCASVSSWVAKAGPGVSFCSVATEAAYEIIHMYDPTTYDYDNKIMQSRYNKIAKLENQLEKMAREFITPADNLPLPPVLRLCWESTARGFLSDFMKWMTYLYHIYLLQVSSVQFVRLFLRCARMSSTGQVARDATVLLILEESKFHRGVSVSLLKEERLGVVRVRDVAERVLEWLKHSTLSEAYIRGVTRRVNHALHILQQS